MKWISLKKEVPPHIGKYYLVYDGENIEIDKFEGSKGIYHHGWYCSWGNEYTHWMHFPKKPDDQ